MVFALIACIYLLFRRSNAIAPEVTPPLFSLFLISLGIPTFIVVNVLGMLLIHVAKIGIFF